jgi:hypothetical protein
VRTNIAAFQLLPKNFSSSGKLTLPMKLQIARFKLDGLLFGSQVFSSSII